MSKILSAMLPLGTKAPNFTLRNVVTDLTVSFSKESSKQVTLIAFICNHCPFVKHINSAFVALANEYMKKGVTILAISSNDVENYPADSPDNMRLTAQQEHYPFPYLYDESQEVAKAYQAACTPDFFIFDRFNSLAYRGQFDDSRPSNAIPPTGASIREALDALLSDQKPNPDQKPSIGCNIKWKNPE
jgi:peroxiredoxin